MKGERPFLTAEWRSLAMLNYVVQPDLIAPLVPPGTEPDLFEGRTYVSLVGFRFLRTRVLGLGIPFHEAFEEVNLRFYVRRIERGTVRRGVVFIREIVPLPAVALVARLAFHENYVAFPMSHTYERQGDAQGIRIAYGWRIHGAWNRIALVCSGSPELPREGSLDQFITEHYWGYCKQRDQISLEYEVRHEPWLVWKAERAELQGDPAQTYGPSFARALGQEPDSAFLAEGSAVSVSRGRRLPP